MNALAFVVGNANYDGEHNKLINAINDCVAGIMNSYRHCCTKCGNLLVVQNSETDSRNKFGNDEVKQIPEASSGMTK